MAVMTLSANHHMTAQALYVPADGVYAAGLCYFTEAPEDYSGTWYGANFYQPNIPLLYSQAYEGKLQQVSGAGSWSLGSADIEALGLVDDAGNFTMQGNANWGIGTYTAPLLYDATYLFSYYFGQYNNGGVSAYTSAGIHTGIDTEPADICMYNAFDLPVASSLYSNTFTYGARDYTTSAGVHVTSDQVKVDFGNPGNNLVISGINFKGVAVKGVTPIADGCRLDVVLTETHADGTVTRYTTYIDASDLVETDSDVEGYAMYGCSAPFWQEVDGLLEPIYPSVSDAISIVISGFRQEGVKLGICTTYDTQYKMFPTYTYFDRWDDGVQRQTADGDVDWQQESTKGANAIINLRAHYNTLCELTTGAQTIYGVAPSAGGLVVTNVADDGSLEANFNVLTTFASNNLEIIEQPDWITDVTIATDAYEQSHCYVFTLTADILDATVTESRSGDVVIVSHGCTDSDEAVIRLHVRQDIHDAYVDALRSVRSDDSAATVTYDLQGRRAASATGLRIADGRIIFVK